MANNELSFRVLAQANTAAIEKLVQMLERLEGKLDALDRKRVNPKIDVDTAKADRDIGAFARNLETKIQAAIRALPKIDLAANASSVDREVQRIRAELASLSDFHIEGHMDATRVHSELEIIRTELAHLAANSPNIQIRTDALKALADLEAVDAMTNKLDGSVANIDANVSKLTGRMTQMQQIMLAVVGLFPVIAAAIVGLPAAFMALAAPIAAIALGIGGITAAFAPLNDAVRRMHQFVGEAFEQGLAPAVANIAQLMDGLTEILGETAERMSLVAFAISEVLASARGMDDLFASLNNVNDLIGAMAPGLALLVANFLALARVGTEGMLPFAAMFEQVGQTWQRVIASMESTGTVQAAVAGLLQLLAALLDVLAPLVQLGAQAMAVLGPPLAAALLLVSAVLQPLVDAFGHLPAVLQTAIVAALAFRAVMAIMGRDLSGAKKGADDLAQSVQKTGQAAQESAGRFAGIRTALKDIEAAYQAGASRGTEFGQKVAEGANRAATALSGGLVSGANKAAAAIGALGTAFDKIGAGLGGLANSTPGALFNNFATSIEQGMARAATAALNGTNAVGNALGRLPSLVGQGLDKVTSVLTSAGSLWGRALDTAGAGISRAGSAINTGIGAVASGVTSAATAVNGAMTRVSDAFGKFLTGGASWSGAMTAASTAARTLGESMRTLGSSVSSGLGAAFTNLPNVVSTATGGFTKFAGVAGGVASAAVKGLSTATLGLVEAMGGGYGIAIAAFTTALGGLGQIQQDVAQKTAQHQAAVDALATSLQASGGAITTNTQALIAKQAEELKLLESAQKLGIAEQDVITAITQGGAAYDSLRGKLLEGAGATDTFISAQQNGNEVQRIFAAVIGFTNPLLAQHATATTGAANSLEEMRKRVVDAAASQQRLAAATQSAAQSFGPAAGFMDQNTRATELWSAAMLKLADNTQTAEAKVTAFSKAFESVSDPARTFLEVMTKADEAMAKFAESTTKITPGMIGLNGTINTSTAAGRELSKSVQDTAKSYDQLFGATLQNLQAQGVDYPQAVGQAAAKTLEYREALIQQAQAHGATREQAEALVQTYFKIPPDMKTTFTQPGMLESMANAMGLKVSVADIPNDKEVRISSPMTPALITQFHQAGLEVIAIPGSKDVIVRANTGEFVAGMQQVMTLADGTTAIVKVDAQTTLADGKIQQTVTFADGQTGHITLDGLPDPATGKINATVTYANGSTGRITVDGNPAPANAQTDSAKQHADTSRGVVTIDGNKGPFDSIMSGILRAAYSVYVTVFGVPAQAAGGIMGPTPYAKGGIHAYDQGGMERLTPMAGGRAKVVAPNTYRIIGDNTDVNESYIPWKKSPWTTSILGRTANALGYNLIPMAEGDVVKYGSVSEKTWEGLLAAGWKGDPTDGMEALYRPVSAAVREVLPAAVRNAVHAPRSAAPTASVTSGSTARLEGRVDRLHDLIERRGIGTNQIVVEDRSGDPVRTARETRLAMRLS